MIKIILYRGGMKSDRANERRVHLGETNPYGSWDAFKSHTEEVLKYIF